MAGDTYVRFRIVTRSAMLALICLGVVGTAAAQNIDCFNRELKLPAAPTEAQATRCYNSINDTSLKADRQGIALYNAARLHGSLAERATDSASKGALYNNVVQDVIRSRDRAPDASATFTDRWDGWRNKEEQLAINRRIVADRGFQLAKAYIGLGKIGGAGPACSGPDDCYNKALGELAADQAARNAGGDVYDETVYLRALTYIDTQRIGQARSDLEYLRNIPRHQAWASSSLGSFYREEAKKRLEPPLTLVKVADARNELNNALGIDSTLLDVRLDYAKTYLQEAALQTAAGDKRTALASAQREYGTAISAAASAPAAQRFAAYAGRGDAFYQEALLESDTPARQAKLSSAITDLKEAAQLDTTATGADNQWKYAQALAAANRPEAAEAFAEAARRYGGAGNGRLAQAEVDFMDGRKLFEAGNFNLARGKFRSVTDGNQGDKLAPAYYYQSAIDLIEKVSPVSNADKAAGAGGGGSPYREQACLARIFAGDTPVKDKTALSACTGSDVLVGLFYLRNAQLVPASQRAAARRLAQEAFNRVVGSSATIQKWPGSQVYSVGDIATTGYALAAWCSTDGSTGIQVVLPADRLNAASDFLTTYRVYACR